MKNSLDKILSKMSLKRSAEQASMDSISSEDTNGQTDGAETRNARRVSTITKLPSFTPINANTSLATGSSTPQDDDDEDESSSASSSSSSSDEEPNPPPTKRFKFGKRENHAPNSNTAASPKITMINSRELSSLRSNNAAFKANNTMLAKEHAKLKRKAAEAEQRAAKVEVYELENARLERELQRMKEENEALREKLGEGAQQ